MSVHSRMRNVLLVLCSSVALFTSAQVAVSGNQNLAIASTFVCSSRSNCEVSVAPSSKLVSPEYVLRKDIREVHVEFSVTDRHGKHITSISPSDFQLTDNGRPIPALTEFHTASDLPLEVAILIDSSASTEHELPAEKQVALEFLRSLLRPQDRALIAGFSTHLVVPGSFTSQFRRLEDSVGSMKSGGLTALNDAVFEIAADDFENAPMARKVLVVITDGYDSVSRRGFDQAMDAVVRHDVAVYTISILGRKSLDPAACLSQLSSATGGHSYVLKDLKNLKQAFTQIDADLRTYYVATYRAPESDPSSFHALSLKLAAPGLTVQNKKGYFLEK